MKCSLRVACIALALALPAGPTAAQDTTAEPVTPEADRKAAEWVLERGGRVAIDPAGGERHTVRPGERLPSGSWRLVRVDLWSCREVTDADADRFAGLDALEHLGLSYTRVGDRAVRRAAALPKLQGLYLAGTSVTDDGIAHLSVAKSVRSLDLSGTQVTDVGLEKRDLKALPLENLFLSRTRVTASGLTALRDRPGLKTLHVVGLGLGEDGRALLKSLPALEELAVSPTADDIPTIAALPALRSLFIYGEDVTDAALGGLRGAKHLERVFLGGTSVSESAAAELAAALADCRVSGYPWKRRSAFLGGPDVLTWEPGPQTAWRGLAARPAKLPGVKRWQVETIHPRSEIAALAFSPDGRTIACATGVGYLRLYDAATLKLRRIIPAIDNGALALSWRPDGKAIVCGGHSTRIQCFDLEGSTLWSAEVPRGPVRAVEWKPDGTALAAGGWDGAVCLFDQDGKAGAVIKTGNAPVLAVAWRPDGAVLATGTSAAGLALWNADGTPAGRMTGHNGRITAMAWRPDGKVLLSGTNGGEVRAWSADGRLQKAFSVGTQEVTDMAWHPQGSEFVASSGDQPAVFSPDGQERRKLPRQKSWVTAVAYAPDGGEVVTANRADVGLKIWGSNGQLKRQIGVVSASFLDVAWHPAGTSLATAGHFQPAQIWGADGRPETALNAGQDCHSVSFRPDGSLVATGGWQVLWVWRPDGVPEFTHAKLPHVTSPAAWKPDGTLLATAHGGGVVHLWKPDGTADRTLKAAEARVLAMAWSPDGQRLATLGGDGVTRLWPDGKGPARELTRLGGSGTALCWSPDGRWLASGGWPGELRLHRPDGTAGPAFPIQNGILSADWSADGERIAVGCHSRGVVVLDARTGQVRHEVKSHGDRVSCVRWSPDGRHVASVGWDATLRIWDGMTLAPEWTAVLLPEGLAAVFTPAGQLRYGDPAELSSHLVYLVEPESGPIEMLTPAQFDARLRGEPETVAASDSPTLP